MKGRGGTYMDVSLTTAIFTHPETAKKEWLRAAGPPKCPYHFVRLHCATPLKRVPSRHVHVSTYTLIATSRILFFAWKKKGYCCNMSEMWYFTYRVSITIVANYFSKTLVVTWSSPRYIDWLHPVTVLATHCLYLIISVEFVYKKPGLISGAFASTGPHNQKQRYAIHAS